MCDPNVWSVSKGTWSMIQLCDMLVMEHDMWSKCCMICWLMNIKFDPSVLSVSKGSWCMVQVSDMSVKDREVWSEVCDLLVMEHEVWSTCVIC